jgi:ATP-dependent DNA helicase PIF1
LRDLIDRNEPFGGIVFVMSGDFCQVLPVIPRGSHADIVFASIKNSYLWESIEVFRLSENMRVGDAIAIHSDLGNHTFVDWFFVLATTSWKPLMRITSSVQT